MDRYNCKRNNCNKYNNCNYKNMFYCFDVVAVVINVSNLFPDATNEGPLYDP